VYDLDYEALEVLLPLAAEHNVSILVVHHTRKAAGVDAIDEISGSFGLTGGVDGFLVMRRDGGGKGVSLVVDGRDIEEPKEYALTRNINTGTWTIEGEAEEVRMSKERADVLLMIRRRGPQSPKDLADLLNVKPGTMRKRLFDMADDGQVVKGADDRYRSPDMNPDDPGTVTGPKSNSNGSNASEPELESQKEASVTGITGVTDDTVFNGNAKSGRLTEEQAQEIQRLRMLGLGDLEARDKVFGERP
jgi:hypothetical protein